MGSRSSKCPELGVPVNPRVNYAAERSKKDGKAHVIDAPILVKVEHGTLRYRYKDDAEEDPPPGNNRKRRKKGRIEVAHEGPERSKKHGYFFHSTLNDFSENANYDKEESWKFQYVYKGPNRAKQKKVYYVYGKGLRDNPTNPGIIRESVPKPQGIGYEWPTLYKVPGHVYYDLSFLLQQEDEVSDDEEKDMTEHAEENQPITMSVGARDRVSKLSARLAVRLVKPVISIHLFYQNTELRSDVMMTDLVTKNGGDRKRHRIRLTPK